MMVWVALMAYFFLFSYKDVIVFLTAGSVARPASSQAPPAVLAT
jgi:hypothetical protein